MARSVRKLGLFTLMALLLLAIVVTAVLSVVAYDRATSGSAQGACPVQPYHARGQPQQPGFPVFAKAA